MKQTSTSVNWGDVAYLWGVLAIVAVAFAVRYNDFKRRWIERSDVEGFRVALVFMAAVYGVFVVCGIVTIFMAAHA